jgi:hypothetical protein
MKKYLAIHILISRCKAGDSKITTGLICLGKKNLIYVSIVTHLKTINRTPISNNNRHVTEQKHETIDVLHQCSNAKSLRSLIWSYCEIELFLLKHLTRDNNNQTRKFCLKNRKENYRSCKGKNPIGKKVEQAM